MSPSWLVGGFVAGALFAYWYYRRRMSQEIVHVL